MINLNDEAYPKYEAVKKEEDKIKYTVVIDGCNVAMRYGNDEFRTEGILL